MSLPTRNWNDSFFLSSSWPSRDLSLPTRNWNSLLRCLLPHILYRIWAYLRGIETHLHRPFSACRLEFEPTYEELKLTFLIIVQQDTKIIWAYLRGIETTKMWGNQRVRSLNLSLPTRNWNSIETKLLIEIFFKFEPTYEELKQKRLDKSEIFTYRFEPTYEELKLLNFAKCIFLTIWFEPTYEELKLYKYVLPRSAWTQIWAYLRGIETNENKKESLGHDPDLSLPTRNWNLEWIKKHPVEYKGFEPTYEELKHSKIFLDGFSPTRFEPTYEELKLSHLVNLFSSVKEIWAYLRGIETTLSSTIRTIRITDLSLPTRNWNWNWKWIQNDRISWFEPTYEELKLSFCLT